MKRYKDTGYFISEDGKVYRFNKEIKQYSANSGEKFVKLCKKGDCKTRLVKELVAETYVLNFRNYDKIIHKDKDKSNNHYTNLMWINTKELAH